MLDLAPCSRNSSYYLYALLNLSRTTFVYTESASSFAVLPCNVVLFGPRWTHLPPIKLYHQWDWPCFEKAGVCRWPSAGSQCFLAFERTRRWSSLCVKLLEPSLASIIKVNDAIVKLCLKRCSTIKSMEAVINVVLLKYTFVFQVCACVLFSGFAFEPMIAQWCLSQENNEIQFCLKTLPVDFLLSL